MQEGRQLARRLARAAGGRAGAARASLRAVAGELLAGQGRRWSAGADELLRRGILVRDARSFGLPAYIRVAARPMEECERLLTVLSGLISSGALEIDKVT